MEQPNIDYNAINNIAFSSEACRYPMTTGHLEIQAVKHAVREISNAILILKRITNDLPLSLLSVYQQSIIENHLEFVSRRIQRFPDRLTTLIVARKQELDGLITDRCKVAEFMNSLQERRAAVDSKEKQLAVDAEAVDSKEKQLAVDAEALNSKEKQLVVEAEAFQENRNTATEKLKEAVKMLRAAEKKEKLLASRERSIVSLEETRALEMYLIPGTDGAADDEADADPVIASEGLSVNAEGELVVDRERRVEKSEEEKAVDDLNIGADVSIEDAAEAAAAEKRVIERLKSPSKKPTPAAENGETSPTDLEKQQSNITHWSSSERDLLGPDSIAAQEERLWQRDARLASLEFYVQNREDAMVKREELLVKLRDKHMQLVQNWIEQVDQMNEALEIEQDYLANCFGELIGLRDEVRETQDRVSDLIREARALVGAGDADGG